VRTFGSLAALGYDGPVAGSNTIADMTTKPAA